MNYRVKTEGMGCPRCIARVRKAMEALGAKIGKMDLNDFTLDVDAAPAVIKTSIEALGFKVKSIEAE